MSAPVPRNPIPYDPEKELRGLLITLFSLSAESIDQIYEEMEKSNGTFGAAAVRLGLVTEQGLADATEKARGVNEQAGLVETAIRRIASDRQIVVKHGESVKPGDELILAHDPYNTRSERLRALRTELLLLNEASRGANVVPVLSPCEQEGRSQLAAELAISFAQLGRKTLLIDADLRKPRLHALFGSTNLLGLSNAIAENGKPHFHPVIGFPVMHLLTAGPIPPNPLELLSDGRFEKLLSEWRNFYEFIVIDTPPISKYADGLAVATLAARVLLVSRAAHTPYKETKAMLRRLETTQSKILGAVLNHF